MTFHLSSAMRTAFPARRFARLLPDRWHTLIRDLLHPYRPELHYMRGPGPKWHAKHPIVH
jgi:hypothetical protein